MNNNDKDINEKLHKLSAEISPSVNISKEIIREKIENEKQKSAKFDFRPLVSVAAAFAVLFTSVGINNFVNRTRISNGFVKSTDYKTVYSVLNGLKNTNDFRYSGMAETNGELAQSDKSINNAAAAQDTAASTDYSKTNLQVLGVEEADIIKTDGKYIYAMGQKYIYIIKADNGKLTILSQILRPENDNIFYANDTVEKGYASAVEPSKDTAAGSAGAGQSVSGSAGTATTPSAEGKTNAVAPDTTVSSDKSTNDYKSEYSIELFVTENRLIVIKNYYDKDGNPDLDDKSGGVEYFTIAPIADLPVPVIDNQPNNTTAIDKLKNYEPEDDVQHDLPF